MATLVDTIENADGGITDFYDDGSWIAYDGSENVIDYAGAQTASVPSGNVVYGSNSIDNGDGTVTTYDAQGNIVSTITKATGQPLQTVPTQVYMPRSASAQDYAQVLANDPAIQFKIGDALNSPVVKDALSKLATLGGQWAAKQFGGNTVLYRKQSGGIGSLDIKSLLIPGAVIAALVFTS